MKYVFAALVVLALTGCEGVRFGLDLANAETTVGISYGDGKTMVRAEQDGQQISGHFAR